MRVLLREKSEGPQAGKRVSVSVLWSAPLCRWPWAHAMGAAKGDCHTCCSWAYSYQSPLRMGHATSHVALQPHCFKPQAGNTGGAAEAPRLASQHAAPALRSAITALVLLCSGLVWAGGHIWPWLLVVWSFGMGALFWLTSAPMCSRMLLVSTATGPSRLSPLSSAPACMLARAAVHVSAESWW